MWELTFSDEFDQDSLDRRKWKSGTPWVPEPFDQGELQTYVPDALRVSESILQLVATRAGDGYHSGMVTTFESFTQKYGRFEIRCRFPAGKGFWPAFWLLPANEFGPPEVDVLEALGRETDAVYMNVHWRQGGKRREAPEKFVGPDFTQDFHTFAVEWDQQKLVWFVDDVERHRVVGRSPDGPMYVLANLAVGGDWPGVPDETTPFPSSYAIDYIRVYRSVPATDGDGEDRDRPQPDRPEDRDRRKPERPKNGKREPPKGKRPRNRE
jgi:beta-glucanase (GH16 family)